jgi:penicillin-binding protein 2
MQLTLGPDHDPQRYRARNRLALAVLFVAVLLLGVRLLLVQVVRGEKYQKFAAIERVTKVRSVAPRGLIKGADGTVLARNIESHSLSILTHRLKPDRVLPSAHTLRDLLDLTDAEYDQMVAELQRPQDPRKQRPVVVRRDLVSSHCPFDSSVLELVPDVRYGSCSTCGRVFEPVPARKACPFDQRRLVAHHDGWRCNTCNREFSDGRTCPYDQHLLHEGRHNLRCPLCQRTFNDEVAVLKAHMHQMPEARVEAEIRREYPFRYLASHLLGYLGFVTPAEMTPLLWLGPPRYHPTDRVGRAGLEAAFDRVLRGVDGEQVLVRRSSREEPAADLAELTAQMAPRPVVPGATLRLTLDLELQRAAKQALKDVYAGAVVVLDAHTGDVLALYSKPSFDPNTLGGKLADDAVQAYAPQLNRALHAFAPASTFKVVAAIAALELGLIKPSTTHHCPGYYDFGGHRFRCHSKRGHGEVDVRKALRASCDVFFYRVGEELGIDRIAEWAARLGFGEPTGVEVREALGRLPTMAWYRSHVRGGYYPGYALSTAVGQKDVLSTPLQLARVYTGLATGTVPEVRLVAGTEDAQGKLTVRESRLGRTVEVQPQTLALVRSALRAVVNEEGGTAYEAQPTRTTMAGKTGTAQAAQRPTKAAQALLADDPGALSRLSAWLQNDHAWFAGWAPADKPEITVAVLVEHGGSGGHNAAPIARQIADAWFARHPQAAPPVVAPKPQRSKSAPTETAPSDDADEKPEPDPDNQPSEVDDPPPAEEAP